MNLILLTALPVMIAVVSVAAARRRLHQILTAADPRRWQSMPPRGDELLADRERHRAISGPERHEHLPSLWVDC